ncbi:MAG: hypothetical protein M5U28_36135 [Sandaracinaceae bacterium]|nr:hypothetical protein [Sandaracinaceae bacterium]
MKGLATLTDTHGIPGVLAWFADAFAPDRRVLANAFGVALRGAVNVIPPEEESDILRAYATAAAIGIVSKDPAVYAETALLRAAADMRGDTSAEAIVSSARALCDPEDTLPAWLHAFQLAQHLGELNPSAAFAHAFVVETLASLARASVLGAENVPLSDLEANE